MILNIVLYCILFSVALMVFDSLTTVFAVLFAVFALHYFTLKSMNRPS